MLRSEIIFTKNQKQNNRHYVICYVISMVYSFIDRVTITLDQSARENSLSYCKKAYEPEQMSCQ